MYNKFIDIHELKDIFLKRILLIIICILLFTSVASIFAFNSMEPRYEARVKIFAGKNENIQSDYNKDELNDYQSLIGTYIEIIKTEDFMNKVIEKANLDLTPGQLLGGLSFTPAGDAPILTISYTSQNREISEKVITTLSTEFEVGVKEIILNTYIKVIDSVKVREILPVKSKVIILGFFAGLVFAIGLVFILDYLDDTVRKKQDLEKVLPIPILGELPIEHKEKHKKSNNKKL